MVSNCVPSPSTWETGNPSLLAASEVRISTGLETTKTTAVFLTPTFWISTRIEENKSVLRLIKSKRDSSGLRRSPAVMQITSESGTCSYPPELSS